MEFNEPAERREEAPLIKAVLKASHDELEQLLSQSDTTTDINALDSDGFTPLYLAARSNDLTSVEILLRNKANPSHSSHLPLEIAIETADPQLVRTLLEYGADPNMSITNMLPLMIACARNDVEIVQTLLEYKADVNGYSDDVIMTPLLYAIASCPDISVNIVNALVEHGARVNLPLSCLLSEAAILGRRDIFDLLLKAGAMLHQRSSIRCAYKFIREKNLEFLIALLDAGADVFAPNYHKILGDLRTYLQEAAGHGNREIIDLLVQRGAKVNESDSGGFSALTTAIQKCNEETAYALLINGADASARVVLKKSSASLPLVASDRLYNVCLAFFIIAVDKSNHASGAAMGSLAFDGDVQHVVSNRSSADFNRKIDGISDVLARFCGLHYCSRTAVEEDVSLMYTETYYNSLIKMQVAGLPLSFEQLKILKDVKFGDYGGKCEEEIKQMRNTVLYDRVTLFDFLRATTRGLAIHMQNPHLEESLSNQLKSGQFVIYKVLLWINYMRGLHYKPIYEIAYDNLYTATNGNLPPNVLEKIMNYIPLKDMYNLYQVCDFSSSTSQYCFYDVFSEMNTSFF